MPPTVRTIGLVLLLTSPAGLHAQGPAGAADVPYHPTDARYDYQGSWPQPVHPATYTAPMESAGIPSEGDANPPPNGRPDNHWNPELLEGSGPGTEAAGPPASPAGGDPSLPPLPPPGGSRRDASGAAADRGGAGTSMVTVVSSLAVVLGLFFVFAWILRRTAPKQCQALPDDVVEVLGRAPLSGRQQVHLLRFGGKLVLVSVTPDGAETLSEITDVDEVNRLAGLCRQSHPSSASHTFKQMFEQLTGQASASASADGRGSGTFDRTDTGTPAPTH